MIARPAPSTRIPRGAEAGFTMVEFLLAAFIMAIGLLGITALQVLALRSTTTSRGMSTSVLVGNAVTERIMNEARQSYLGMVFSGAPSGKTRYIGKAPVQANVKPTDPVPNGAILDYYDFNGSPLTSAAGAYFTSATWIDSQVKGSGSTGNTDTFVVRVTFVDTVNANQTVRHSINLDRTVIHA